MSQDSNAFEMIQRETKKWETEDWDDGSDHDDVTKIYVIGGTDRIQLIKIDYVKSGQPKNGSFHGYSKGGFMQMVRLGKYAN